jgi:hypothetical protein
MPLPLPRNWIDFEDLCCDLWSKIWKDPDTQKHGRQGQPQSGVDVYGQPNKGDAWAGVQCKYKEHDALTSQEILEEVEKARTFDPPISRFIIATTAPRDAKLQRAVRLIHQAERRAGSFSVTVCFWDYISSKLTQEFPELARKYYPEFVLDLGSAGLEISIERDEYVDIVSLTPLYSSEDLAKPADRTELYAYLSGIKIANHDSSPTEVQRMWVAAIHSKAYMPGEVREERLTGERRIEARGQRRYELEARYILDGRIAQDEKTRVVLRVKSTGLQDAELALDSFFASPLPRGKDKGSLLPVSAPNDLIGRDAVYQRLLTILRNDDSVPVVGIRGMGGIGKTFLASKITQNLLHDPAGFTTLITMESQSARPSRHKEDGETLTFDAILSKIIETIRGWTPKKWPLEEKEKEVKDILLHHRIILFLDNLETAEDNLAIGIGGLITLFSGTPSKALLVSRFPLPCHSEELEGLDDIHAREYVRRRLRLVGIYDTAALPEIARSAGGSPLAIEVVVGLISKLPRIPASGWEASVKEILDRMHTLRKRHRAAPDPTMAFFLDVFDLSWNRKSEDNDIIYFLVGSSPQSPYDIEYLCSVASLPVDTVSEQLRELYELALVHISSEDGKSGYFLHPLTDAWVSFNFYKLKHDNK